LIAHDLFEKPLHTFPDHALVEAAIVIGRFADGPEAAAIDRPEQK
jgi:hypothetical protein